MPGLTNEELAQLLDQVDSKDFVQFFSDRNIPPPGDGSKKDMIARLLAEYRNDARAALVFEVRNTTGKLGQLIADLSTELKRESGGVRILTQTFQIALAVIGSIIAIAGFFGTSRLMDLNDKSKEADTTLKSVQATAQSYVAHIHRIAADDLGSIMSNVSTRFFDDADRPLKAVVESDITLLSGLPSDVTRDASSSATTEALLMQFRAIKRILDADTKAAHSTIVQELQGLDAKLEAIPLAGRPIERGRYRSYVSNLLGVAYYARYLRDTKSGSLSDLKDAEKHLRAAISYDVEGSFAPPRSNLAVLMLDRLEDATKNAKSPADRAKLEQRYSEPDDLLTKAQYIAQPSRAMSKIYNNLAYSSLQRAFIRLDAHDQSGAVAKVDDAIRWTTIGLSKETPAPVLVATKAEATALKSFIRAGSADAEALAATAISLLREARARGYDFKVQSEGDFFAASPCLARFAERSDENRRGTLLAIGLQAGK